MENSITFRRQADFLLLENYQMKVYLYKFRLVEQIISIIPGILIVSICQKRRAPLGSCVFLLRVKAAELSASLTLSSCGFYPPR